MIPIAIGVVVLVFAVGLAIALSGTDGKKTGRGPTDEEVSPFGPVDVEGDPLPTRTDGADEAIGLDAPTIEGMTPARDPISLGEDDRPTLVAFLAHWCPHCQNEVPTLVELAEKGIFDDVRLVAVLSGTNPDAPNYPPVDWLDRENWPGEIMLDDVSFTGGSAYGLDGYPFLVYLDGEGRVAGRTSGASPPDVVTQFIDRITS